MSEEASSSMGAPARTSGRNKVKSQRVIEMEDTARMVAAAKAKQKAEQEAEARGDVKPSNTTGSDVSKAKNSKTKGKGKGKAKKVDLYCVCKKPSDEDDGPMIECAECNDWFHFSCIDLTEDMAERIHNYVCSDCTEATGNKTTMMYDISTFKSPSPTRPPPKATKRKTSRSVSQQQEPSTDETSTEDPSEEVDNPPESSSTSSSDSGSDAAVPQRQVKRPRSSKEPSQRPPSVARATVSRPLLPANRKNTVLLPKARLFVLDRLAILVKGIFGEKLDDEGVHRYAKNLEESLFEGFKDGQGPKAVAGGRYKTQFTLLDRSLPKARPELLADITSFTLPAAKVAQLTSADLASAERLEELEKAKRAALEQTVKQKDDIGTIRMGRDGFEKVEDSRERELVALARQEQAARREAERRESVGTPMVGGEDGDASGEISASPSRVRRESSSANPQIERKPSSSLPQSPVVKRESVDTAAKSPLKSNFGLKSAWSAGANETGEKQSLSLGDQTVLDLSDIVAEEPDELDVKMDLDEEYNAEETKEEKLDVKPVVWTGNIVNPAVDGSLPVPISARVVARNSFEPQWKSLLPQETIAITGRVPIPASLKYLGESRLNPGRDLVTVVFTLNEGASEEEQKTWGELNEFHLNKERHAIFHPHGTRGDLPYHAARELYLIPMRANDPVPEFTEMLDQFSFQTIRDTPVLLGVFIGDKRHLHAPPPPPVILSPLPPMSVDTPAPAPAVAAAVAPPLLPNAKLQELMASLNPAALQSVLSGAKSPMTAAHQMSQTQQSHDPYTTPQHVQQHPYHVPSQYDQRYQNHQGYHPPYPPTDYPGYDQPYQSNHYSGYTPDGPGHQDRDGRGGGSQPWQQSRQYGRENERDRDNGWSSRGGGHY